MLVLSSFQVLITDLIMNLPFVMLFNSGMCDVSVQKFRAESLVIIVFERPYVTSLKLTSCSFNLFSPLNV